jgi:hypothetical protein
LGLTGRPCIFNALLKFIHQCISSILRTRYDPIQSEESMI